VRFASRVVISEDADGRAIKVLIELRLPLTGTHRVRCRGQPERFEGVDVLLALDDVHHLAVLYRFEYLRQPVRHTPHTFRAPPPSAVAVRAALAEILR
jgi:hypothetical protein